MTSIDDVLKGDFSNQVYKLDPGLTQTYLLKYSVENNILLHSIIRRQYELEELIKVGKVDDGEVDAKYNAKINELFEASKKELYKILAHISSVGEK
ncbi:hypothetical protein [Ohtaekwangia koreensis]|uniref:Uncharacterized protein n=1 Tax=Ohtaekwangia koreensis TaxID=688867 RepID=A0A1T5JQV1_9BACT|nr:hypothetical protein [Ohtaekwangia koreensis]SKC53618.1 hypothetical protein SAMN05660236_1366 [Ohtaekwangia koreensis]